MWLRIRSMGASSMTKALMRMSALQLGQVSASDANGNDLR